MRIVSRSVLVCACLGLAVWVVGGCSHGDDPDPVVSTFTASFDPVAGTGSVAADGRTETPVDATVAWAVGTRTLTLSLSITNNTARLMFNPKLVVTGMTTGVTFDNPDGTNTDGDGFRYFGPTALDIAATSAVLDFIFTVPDDVDITISLEVVTHPSLFTSCTWGSIYNGAVSVIDVGQDVEVDVIITGFDSASLLPWYSVLSPDARYLYVSCRGDGNAVDGAVVQIDTTLNSIVDTLILVPTVGSNAISMGGIAISADGAALYVAGVESDLQWSSNSTGQPLVSIIDTATFAETDRIALAGSGRTNDVLLDQSAGRLYVAMLDQQGVAVVDVGGATQIDTDGDGSNGVTPIAMPYAKPGGLEMAPQGGEIWVSFSQDATPNVAYFDTGTFAVSTLASTVTGASTRSGPNLEFGPDGRLYVPRTQYDSGGTEEGLSIFDIAGATEVQVTTPSSGNNDNWDVAFWPAGNRCYISQSDAGEVAVVDITTDLRIDTDGIGANGVTNITSATGGFYGGAMTITPW